MGQHSNMTDLINSLRRLPNEIEWVEFKRSNYEPQQIGEYLSALANSACLAARPYGYLCFGIDDDSHDVVGTTFDPYAEKGKGNQDLLIWLNVGLAPSPHISRVSSGADAKKSSAACLCVSARRQAVFVYCK